MCPSKDVQKQTKEYVARNLSFSATVSLKLFYKVGCFPAFLAFASRPRPPNKRSSRTQGSSQNLQDSKPSTDWVRKITPEYGKLRRIYGTLRRSYGNFRRSYDAPFFEQLSAKHWDSEQHTFHNPKLVQQALQTCVARTISQRPDILKQREYIIAYVLSATRASHCIKFI